MDNNYYKKYLKYKNKYNLLKNYIGSAKPSNIKKCTKIESITDKQLITYNNNLIPLEENTQIKYVFGKDTKKLIFLIISEKYLYVLKCFAEENHPELLLLKEFALDNNLCHIESIFIDNVNNNINTEIKKKLLNQVNEVCKKKCFLGVIPENLNSYSFYLTRYADYNTLESISRDIRLCDITDVKILDNIIYTIYFIQLLWQIIELSKLNIKIADCIPQNIFLFLDYNYNGTKIYYDYLINDFNFYLPIQKRYIKIADVGDYKKDNNNTLLFNLKQIKSSLWPFFKNKNILYSELFTNFFDELNNLNINQIQINLIEIIKYINNPSIILFDKTNLEIKDKCINNLLLKKSFN
jgi:hypothetical protein